MHATAARPHLSEGLRSGDTGIDSLMRDWFAPAPGPVRMFIPSKWGINSKLPEQQSQRDVATLRISRDARAASHG